MRILSVCGALFIAFLVQAQIVDRIYPADFRPMFVLATLLTVSMFLNTRELAGVTLFAAVLDAALVGGLLWPFVLSRIGAALTGLVVSEPLNYSVFVAFTVGCLGTLVAGILFLIVQPPAALLDWLGHFWKTVLFTGVITACISPVAATFLPSVPQD